MDIGIDKGFVRAIDALHQQGSVRYRLGVTQDGKDKDARVEDAYPNQLERVSSPERIECKCDLDNVAQNKHRALQRHDIGPRNLVYHGIYPTDVLCEEDPMHLSATGGFARVNGRVSYRSSVIVHTACAAMVPRKAHSLFERGRYIFFRLGMFPGLEVRVEHINHTRFSIACRP
jgi:hypothetical protein